jgi:DNA primase
MATVNRQGKANDYKKGVDVFKEVKKRVALAEYFENELGCELNPENGGYKCLCPFHEEDSPSMKLRDDPNGNGWLRYHCFGCGGDGTIIDAVIEHEGFDPEKKIDAVRHLNEFYKLALPLGDRGSSKAQSAREVKTSKNDGKAKSYASALWQPTPLPLQALKFLKARGLSNETIKHFGLGVIDEDWCGARISIPVTDTTGAVRFFTRRAIYDDWSCSNCGAIVGAKKISERAKKGEDAKLCPSCRRKTIPAFMAKQHPKYRNDKSSEKSLVLYNEPSATKHFLDGHEDRPLIVCEGAGDVWAAHEAGHGAAVAYNGQQLSEAQAERLIRLVLRGQRATKQPHKYILLVPDFDAAGRTGLTANLDTIQKVAARLDAEEERLSIGKETASGLIVRVLTGVDDYPIVDVHGKTNPCKDLGGLLQTQGAERTCALLAEHTITPAEWRIVAALDDEHSARDAQEYEVAQILESTPYALHLEQRLTPKLAEHWGLSEEAVRQFVRKHAAREETAGRLTEQEAIVKKQKARIAKMEEVVREQRAIHKNTTLTTEQKIRGLSKTITPAGRAETPPATAARKSSHEKPPAVSAGSSPANQNSTVSPTTREQAPASPHPPVAPRP